MTTTSYSQELQTLVQVYAETYNEEDLLAVLEDCRGDLQLAFDRISEGNVSQWQTQKQPRKEKVKPIPTSTARRGGRQSGRGRGGRTVHGSDRSHGGERTFEKEKESVESDNATIANTEDWGNTANSTTEKEWKKAVEMQELEQKTSKVSLGGKKNFTVIKKNEKSAQPKKSNWASVVKGPEPVPEPVIEPEPVVAPSIEKKIEKVHTSTAKTVQKKLVLVKKDQQPHAPAVSEPTPSPPITTIARDWNPVSPRAKSVQVSPSIMSRSQISPVSKSGVMSPPNQIDSASIENTIATLSPRIGVQESTSLPPGLTRPINGPRTGKTQQLKKPEGAVVLPSSAPSISGKVQFGSFGIAQKSTPSSESNPKSPDKIEESNSTAFQFNAGQSTSNTSASARPISSEQATPMGAPGLPNQYQQPVFGLGGANYSMYEQQRAMGYYVPEQPSNAYPSKYGQDANTATPQNPSQTPASQIAQTPNAQAHFQPYPYYPYYMNQYQQSPYQPPVYQQHFSGKNTYGGAGFQTPVLPNGHATAKGTQQATSQQAGYYGGAQQFYPNGYEEDPYGGKQNYPQTFFGGQSSGKPDYKQQNRQPRPPYEKASSQTSSQQQLPQQQQANHAVPYYGGQQFSDMHYQQLMMHPQGYPQNPGYAQSHGRGGPQAQQGYWNGN